MRRGSPPPGRSILITSAPRSASIIAQYGAAMYWPISRTRTPSSALTSFPFGQVRDDHWLDVLLGPHAGEGVSGFIEAVPVRDQGAEVVLGSGLRHEVQGLAVLGDMPRPG